MEKIEEVAIFWDYENVKVSTEGINVPIADSLLEYTKTIGHPRIKKVYSNWAGVKQTIIQALYSLGFEPIQVSMGKPNSVDLKLAVDCLDIAFSLSSIKHFIIVTGDKDFIPVVNWLKSQKKEVIIIGKSDIISEHLLMSADGFVSLEELSKMEKSKIYSKTSISPTKTISFESAIKCLNEVIQKNREQGKSSRFLIIDSLMRSSPNYDYNGATSVEKPDHSGTFSTFTQFINAVEEVGKIKSTTVEGFRELFLIEEDPNIESEFSPELADEIKNEHWKIIYDQIIKAFETRKKKKDEESLLFNFILAYVGNLKGEKNLHYTSQAFRGVLEKLIEIGSLLKVSKEKYSLAPDSDMIFNNFYIKLK